MIVAFIDHSMVATNSQERTMWKCQQYRADIVSILIEGM